MSDLTASLKEVRAAGLDAVRLATSLLPRARRADPPAAQWAAADVQWWWRKPQRSDDVEQLFWLDGDGPVAGVLLTSSADDSWQCDPVVVSGVSGCKPDIVWGRALEHAAAHASGSYEVPVSDGDAFDEVARISGLTPGYSDSTGWMVADDRPAVSAPAEGFMILDRTQRLDVPHHMRHRSGELVKQRLQQCSLYDPVFDLVVEFTDGLSSSLTGGSPAIYCTGSTRRPRWDSLSPSGSRTSSNVAVWRARCWHLVSIACSHRCRAGEQTLRSHDS